jgi:hypothetical protein
MITTLHDHLITGGDWPPELGRRDVQDATLAVCTCGRVRSPHSVYHLKPTNVPPANRLSGRTRRSRMTADRRQYADRAARMRAREPEVSPGWACNVCLGAMKTMLGITRDELDRRLGQ